MRTLVLVALLLIPALAGCAEAPAAYEDDSAFEDLDTRATEDTGVIRGVVIDLAVVPIDGVTVEILNTEFVTTSNEDGAFFFEGLAPGAYFLSASKAGYSTVQQSVQVVAGVDRPDVVKFRLEADAKSGPYVTPHQFDGFLECSLRAGFIGYALCAGIGEDTCCNRIDDLADPNLSWVQSEATWESTQELGDEMGWSITCMSGPQCPDGQIILNEERKTSPLIVRINQTLIDTFWTGENRIDERMFADGYSATDVEEEAVWDALGQCVEWPVIFEACVRYNGVGVIVQQGFTAYDHFFYNGWTPDPEWTFLEDGSPVPPV